MLTDRTRDQLQRRIDALETESADLREALRIERDDLCRERDARQVDLCRIDALEVEAARHALRAADLREHLAWLVDRAQPIFEAMPVFDYEAPPPSPVSWGIHLSRGEYEAVRRASEGVVNDPAAARSRGPQQAS